MALRFFDTYSRQVRDFVPLQPPRVGLYACGLTVYDYAHIGNLRTYIFEDILRRTLEAHGYDVLHVQNITDVGHLVSDADTGEDKMEKGSRRTGKSAWELADFFTAAFQADLQALNILPPHIWPKATGHIAEQIELIACIEEEGFVYRTADGIYFDTSALPSYGYLARLDVAGLQAGARIDVGEKRNPTDFALWKFSPPGAQRQMEWDSPWGTGFPGWHIECSAMAAKYLGTFFDIHCGGEDHISVHHTNEIAQSEACHKTRLANFWLHGYFLVTSGEKMAKSAGEFLRLQTLLDEGYDPLSYRYLCLNAHYRSRLTFSWEALDGAATALNRLRQHVYRWGDTGAADEAAVARFTAAMDDDLNTPQALAVVWEIARGDLPPAIKKATILACDCTLGLGLAAWAPPQAQVPPHIQALVDQREQARAARDWAEADRLRDEIRASGFDVTDSPHGPQLKARTP
ncbi:MAG: cysteine--tRNA ligase [Anaerolineae bacterium]|nr:cysteine--tRNA ligase [Anaerolineae bacterium]